MTRWTALFVTGWTALGLSLYAHHPVAEVYDEKQTLILEGEVTSFLFGDPHSMVHLLVRDTDGDTHTWAVEWRAALQLEQLGWNETDLNEGERVRICGHPGRDPGAFRLYLRSLTQLATGKTTLSPPPDASTPCAR